MKAKDLYRKAARINALKGELETLEKEINEAAREVFEREAEEMGIRGISSDGPCEIGVDLAEGKDKTGVQGLISDGIARLRMAQQEEIKRLIEMGFGLHELVLEEHEPEWIRVEGFIKWELKWKVRPKTEEEQKLFNGFVWRRK